MFSPQSTQDDATVLLPNGLGNRLPVVPKLGLRRRARRQLVPCNAARAPERRGDSLSRQGPVHPQWTARARRPGATLTRLRPRYPEHNPCDNVFSKLVGKMHVYLGSSTSRPRPESCGINLSQSMECQDRFRRVQPTTPPLLKGYRPSAVCDAPFQRDQLFR